jgi:5-methylcytosine-specific restriction endonuclease McrA
MNTRYATPQPMRTQRGGDHSHPISSSIDRPVCKECGKSPCLSKGYRNGKRRWMSRCAWCKEKRLIAKGCKRSRGRTKSQKRMLLLKPACEMCGFVPVIAQQLQLDHIDGNRANNHPSNRQTLCANCHVLKTVRSGDDKPRERPAPSYVWSRGRWERANNVTYPPPGEGLGMGGA